MTVTREQAQMLTALAIACRPHRAPTWDEAGIMAAIGKLRDSSLSSVALRVIVAASDREAKTPAVITSPGMQIPETKPPLWQPNPWDPNLICSVCSKPRPQCEGARFADDDHEFVSRATNAADTLRPAEALERIVTDLRQRTADEPPERPEPETTTAGTERVAPIRAQLAHPVPQPHGPNSAASNVAGSE